MSTKPPVRKVRYGRTNDLGRDDSYRLWFLALRTVIVVVTVITVASVVVVRVLVIVIIRIIVNIHVVISVNNRYRVASY